MVWVVRPRAPSHHIGVVQLVDLCKDKRVDMVIRDINSIIDTDLTPADRFFFCPFILHLQSLQK